MTDETENQSWVINVTDQTFVQEVIERSKQTPVVVDFWATWCGPCRLLGPVLEKLADEFAGRFILAKADTEQTQQVAAEFGVQSIPAVYALRDAKVVQSFIGVLDEPKLRAWLDAWLPSPAEEDYRRAQQLLDSDPVEAEKLFRQVLEFDAKLWDAKIGLAGALLRQNKLTESRSTLNELAARGMLQSNEAQAIDAELKLRESAPQTGDWQTCQEQASAHPEDLPLQWELAQAAAGAKQYELALQTCLRLVEHDKMGLGQPAKEMMVNLFQVLGHSSDIVKNYRRRLSSLLY